MDRQTDEGALSEIYLLMVAGPASWPGESCEGPISSERRKGDELDH